MDRNFTDKHTVAEKYMAWQAVSRAQGILNNNKAKIVADFAPEHKAEGLAAMEKLDTALKDFQKSNQAGDKQVHPLGSPMLGKYMSFSGWLYCRPQLMKALAPMSTCTVEP